MSTQGFRSVFVPRGGQANLNWFPGHMAKGLRLMREKLKEVDCVVEVHDARVPLSGRNRLLTGLTNSKPHLLVLNKADLGDETTYKKITSQYTQRGLDVIFSDSVHNRGSQTNRIIPTILRRLAETNMEKEEYSVMIVGMPNVGKSSLINAWRRMHLKIGTGARTGGEPGITRSAKQSFVVHASPKVTVVDTPGVMMPHIDDYETGMKLALIGTLRDHIVGEEYMADYLLYCLNKLQNYTYVQRFKLSEPSDDIDFVLTRIARHSGLLGKGGVENTTEAAGHFVRRFREGALGRICLDKDIL
eukprot:comp43423_c0_seq1/m.47478 comp43423_c0_seq1/g.47478  ORF comp43423_c0_seq1/g.47478 comp43423_c0_seq1/m.47478 type:complete len:302 (-) comp43423_c0_seq1:57-962(-)